MALGPFKQLLVYPDPKREGAVQQVSKRLATQPLNRKDVRSPAAEVVRRLGSSWMVTMNYEAAAKRFTLTLPREARLLGLCPAPGKAVVVYPYGGFVELWRRDDWVAHEIQADHADSDTLMDEAEESWTEE